MQTTRRKFHEELDELEREIIAMAELAEAAMGRAAEALQRRDRDVADQVIAGDDAIDGHYLNVERRLLDLFATQTPVASDLRLVFAILHINLHLERVGDIAVNVCKISNATLDLPSNERILTHLQEMSDVVRSMLRTAIQAFTLRDLELCLQLPKMDDPVDRLNRDMYQLVAGLSWDTPTLEWGIRMNIVSRQLERVGDHAVDIGEQIAFFLTGEFREFTDASHPLGLGPEAPS